MDAEGDDDLYGATLARPQVESTDVGGALLTRSLQRLAVGSDFGVAVFAQLLVAREEGVVRVLWWVEKEGSCKTGSFNY